MSNFVNPEDDTYARKIILASGTATEPSLTFANDLTKGIYFADGQIQTTAGGGSNPLLGYEKPNLLYVSTTEVSAEIGLGSDASSICIVFPDGDKREDLTPSHIIFDDTRVANLSGTARSGLDTGTVTDNTWYSIYAVKVSDSTTDLVLVGSLNLPLPANKAALDASFGADGYVYLGTIRVGDNITGTDIVPFDYCGDSCEFRFLTGSLRGIQFLAASGDYTSTRGTGATEIPDQFLIATYSARGASTKNVVEVGSGFIFSGFAAAGNEYYYFPASTSANLTVQGSGTVELWLAGFKDSRI